MNFVVFGLKVQKTQTLLGIRLLNGDPWEKGVSGDTVEGKGRRNKTRDERDIWENGSGEKGGLKGG